MRWGEIDTCKFAKLYIKNECLWNTEHPDYKIKPKRAHAFRELIAEFYDSTGIKLNEAEVKVKIKNLRSTYSQEVTKIKTRSRAGAIYTPTIRWFNDFHKHLNIYNERRHSQRRDDDSSYDDVIQPYTTQDETEEGCQEIWTAPGHALESTDQFPETDEDYKLLVMKPEPNEHIIPDNDYKIKKKKLKRRHISADGSERTFRGSLDSSTDSTKDDEFDIYGKYIATQLRKMNLQKALRIQLEIQQLVSEARISGINDH